MATAALLAGVLLLLLQASALAAGPLDDTHRNDGLSMQEAGLYRSAVYEAIKRSASSRQQPPVYFSLTQTITAPTAADQHILPVCVGPEEVSRALEVGISTAFRAQMDQEASVDTTYVQKLDHCTYRSLVAYWGSADIATAIVEAGKAGKLCDKLPQYCQSLNIMTATAAAARPARTVRKAVLRSSVPSASSSSSSSSGRTHARRRSTAPYILSQGSGSTAPELPPVLHYNCQKHYFLQRLDHFADDAKDPKHSGPDDNARDDAPNVDSPHGPGAGPGPRTGGPHPGYDDDLPSRYGMEGAKPGPPRDVKHWPSHAYDHERDRMPHKHPKIAKKFQKVIKTVRKYVKGHKMQHEDDTEDIAELLSFPEEYYNEEGDLQISTHTQGDNEAAASVQASIQRAPGLGASWKPRSSGSPQLRRVSKTPPTVAGSPTSGKGSETDAPEVSSDLILTGVDGDAFDSALFGVPRGPMNPWIDGSVQAPATDTAPGLEQQVLQEMPVEVDVPAASDVPEVLEEVPGDEPAGQHPAPWVVEAPAPAPVPAPLPAPKSVPAPPRTPARAPVPTPARAPAPVPAPAPKTAAAPAQDKLSSLLPGNQKGPEPQEVPEIDSSVGDPGANRSGGASSPSGGSGSSDGSSDISSPETDSEVWQIEDGAEAEGPGEDAPEDGSSSSSSSAGGSGSGADSKQTQGDAKTADKDVRFKQVYWVCDAAWPTDAQKQRESGNVVVFLGNEGPLGVPQQPIVFENARRLNALVVLIEHRYYGESLPFEEPTDGPLATDKYQWLNLAQVMEDTVAVVAHVRKQHAVPQATPNIAVGGSYGGMLAAYHRLKRPDYFASAVASSAPMQYIVNTPMWEESASRYHQLIQRAADVVSGSTACSSTIREGLAMLLDAGISVPGRQQLAQTFKLCDASKLDSKRAVQALMQDMLYTFQGFAQVNNQPPLLGQMALACQVMANTTAAGGSALEALSAVHTYFNSDGYSDWCYSWGFDPKVLLVPGSGSYGYNSYSYQCCTQGTAYSSLLPARGFEGVLNPEDLSVSLKSVQAECRTLFGSDIAPLHSPGFARNFMRLLQREGGVVFTNGDLDGWAGGSLGVTVDSLGGQKGDSRGLQGRGHAEGVHVSAFAVDSVGTANMVKAAATGVSADSAAALGAGTAIPAVVSSGGSDSSSSIASRARGKPAQKHPKQRPSREEPEHRPPGHHGYHEHEQQHEQEQQQQHHYQHPEEEDQGDAAGKADSLERVAFITYRNASHCTDTHTYAWQMPGEPAEWKQQRAEAMNRAVAFAMPTRLAVLRDLRADPLLPLVPESEEAM